MIQIKNGGYSNQMTSVNLNDDDNESRWEFGPDELIPSDTLYATRLGQAVKLRMTNQDAKRYPPMSIYTMFKNTVQNKPDHSALAVKQDDKWLFYSYLKYWKICHRVAKSFIQLGLKPDNCVGIIGFNSDKWFFSLLGAIIAGGVGCGIYTTNSEETCQFILEDSGTQIIVVENKQQLDKIIKCRDSVNIRAIIQYTGEIENDYGGLVYKWDKFFELGKDVPDEVIDERVQGIAPNKCATLIYTSGTTGNPKAVMISHDNVTYLVRSFSQDFLKLNGPNERLVTYLPLSHIAGQLLDIYNSIFIGATIYFAQPDALKGSLVNTLQEAKPTIFLGVPRVWEKFQEKIEASFAELVGTKSKLVSWARVKTTEKIHFSFEGNAKIKVGHLTAKLLVINKLLKKVGLDECKKFYSGAAPITKETLDFFVSIGIPLCEVYGMSESAGPHCGGLNNDNRITSVGKATEFNRTKLLNKISDGSGELCMYGRHIFMGYLNSESKTLETFDDEGWLKTGDIAKIDNDGFIYITGRLKELIITAGGENIAPIPIEDSIKSELPRLISNCMLVGDKKKYLVVLVTLKSKVNLDTLEPIDDLTDDCIQFLKSIGSKSTKVFDIKNNKDQLVYNEVEKAIKRANDKSVSRASKVQKFAILPRDFSLPTGELGPTLKLRRPIVAKMYQDVINDLYIDKNGSGD